MAALMVLSMVSAFALAADGDTVLTVTGLEQATSVKYYKVIEWDETVPGGWKWAAPYNSAEGFTNELLKEITGTPKTETAPAVAGKITADTADKIAGVSNNSALDGGTLDSTKGEWSVTVNGLDTRGLYMVVPTAATPSTVIYNPVFVAANHGDDAESVSTASGYAAGTIAMAKVSTLDVSKEADKYTFNGFEGPVYDANSAKPGDIITFTVTTTIPVYADNYINPVFKISDQVSDGMKIKKDTIAIAGLTQDNQYTLTFDDTDKDDFVITFKSDYIKGLTTNQAITLTYKAEVTDAAPKTVNEQDNKVKINFSNGPEDEQGHGEKRDRTKHYTFSLDATILGSTTYQTSELVKVGLNPDGSEITETKTYSNGTKAGALANAEFELKDASGKVIRTVTTTDDGYIHFEGLDVGTYTLTETKAPSGYVRDTSEHTVEISAVVKHDLEETDDDGYTYTTDRLESYSVKVDGTTSTYTFTNEGGTINQVTTAGDKTTKITNTQGLELPSTGGMGTTVLYVAGSILVLAAAILLITKRRMNAEE